MWTIMRSTLVWLHETARKLFTAVNLRRNTVPTALRHPELDGVLGFVSGARIRVGDIIMFPAREIIAKTRKSDFTVTFEIANNPDEVRDSSELLFVFRPADSQRALHTE